MIPVVQSIVGSGADGQPPGDCVRACVASIFELPIDRVPHFTDGAEPWIWAMEKWLAPFGLTLEREDYREGPSDNHPRRYHDGWWIASVISENIDGATHAIVMHETDVRHDPSPSPRRTPYRFVGECYFVAADPALIRRAVAAGAVR